MRAHLANHANFRDPVGLVVRMLRSGDRAARSALLRAASTVLLTPIDRLLVPRERRRIQQAGASTFPLLLIVGAPRSGTTFVYQTLARYLSVTYFNNLSALFPNAPLTASALFTRFLPEPTADFHSYYGNTAGLAAPNDGFHIWNRWLGTDRYRTPQELAPQSVEEMRRFFAAWTNTFARPLLNKNNRNADCVALLGSVFPNAYFIEVRRDPVYVVQSLLIARQRIQGSKAIAWGLGSRDQDPSRGALSYVDDVCEQVYRIELKLQDDKRRLGPDRFIEVSYEGFCDDPARTIEQVAQRTGCKRAHPGTLGVELSPHATNEIRLEASEFRRIEERIADLYRSMPAGGRPAAATATATGAS
jgi:hypothetical protein